MADAAEGGSDFPAMTEQGKALDAVLLDLEQSAGRFGSAMTSALSSAVRGGQGLDDILKSTGLRLVDIALSAGLKPLQDVVSSGIGSVFERLGQGAISGFGAGAVSPFSAGGGLAVPQVLAGLSAGAAAGVASPATGGNMTTAPSGAASGGMPNVVFNVTASDAESFRRSEGQIAAMLTRTVGRGRRGI